MPLPGRLRSQRSAVEQKLDSICGAVDLDVEEGTRRFVPGPATDRIGPRPAERRRILAGAGRPVDGDVRVGSKAEDYLTVIGCGPAVSGDVDVAAPGEHCRELRGV